MRGQLLSAVSICLSILAWSVHAQTVFMDDAMISGQRAGSSSGSAQIEMDRQGNATMCWRQTAPANNYYVRQMDSDGVFLGTPAAVGTASSPAVGPFCFDLSDSGTFAVTWTNNTTIFLKRYNRDGSAYDAVPFQITLPAGDSIRIGSLAMAIKNDGEILLCWRPFNLSIRAIEGMILGAGQVPVQRRFTYAPEGATSLSDPVVAMSDAGNFSIACRHVLSNKQENRIAVYRSTPSISHDTTVIVGDSTIAPIEGLGMLRSGRIIVAWYEALASGGYTLVYRHYGGNGRPLGNSIFVQTGSNHFFAVRVKTAPDNDYIISWLVAWTVQSQTHFTPFCRVFNVMGEPLSGILRPADDNPDNSSCSVDPAIDGTVNAALVFDNGDNTPVVQFFRKNGTMMRGDLPVCHTPVMNSNPGVAMGKLKNGINCLFSWEDATGSEVNVLDFKLLSGIPGVKGGFSVANDAAAEAARPAITCDSLAGFIAWEDKRLGVTAPACYGRVLGTPSATDLVLSNQGVTAQNPSCAIGKNAVLAVWQDVRAANGTSGQIYAQRLSRAGALQGENSKINGTLANGNSPSVGVDAAGTFSVVWHTVSGTFPTQNSNVYLQRISSTGTLLGTPLVVNSVANRAGTAVVAADSAGMVAVAWLDQRDELFLNHVYCRLFDASGNPQGTDFRCDTSAVIKSFPGIGIGRGGVVVVSWQSGTGVTQAVVSRQFSSGGTALTGEVRHNSTAIRATSAAPALAVTDSIMALAWLNSNHANVQFRDVWAEIRAIKNPQTDLRHEGVAPVQQAQSTRAIKRGSLVSFGRQVRSAEVYSMSGRLLTRIHYAASVVLPKSNGLFIVRVDGTLVGIFPATN